MQPKVVGRSWSWSKVARQSRLGPLAGLGVGLLAVGAVSVFGCGGSPLSGRPKDFDRLAVIVRVHGDLKVAARPVEGLCPNQALSNRIEKSVSTYALEESLRRAWLEAVERPVPWRVASSLQVASTMGTLLAREEKPRYDRLKEIGIDTVLEVWITEWGVASRRDQLGGFLRLEARLIRLGRRDKVIWRGRARVDRSRARYMPAEDVRNLLESDAAIEALFADLVRSAGQRLAKDMGVAPGA